MIVATPADRPLLQQGRWDLSVLLPDPSQEGLSAALDALRTAADSFAASRSALRPGVSREAFLAVLREYEAVVERMAATASWASLQLAADTQSSEALTRQSLVQQTVTSVSNGIMFLELWWKDLSDAEAAGLLPDDPDLAHCLTNMRRFRPYTLDERCEQVISLKDADGMDGLLTLYSILTNRLEFRLTVDGEERSLTRDELTARFTAPDPAVRAAAYRELLAVFRRESTPLAQIYASRVRDWYHENVDVRGYSSPIAVRNLDNDIPDAAVEVLLDVVREGTAVFHRYFRLKARLLGLDRLRRTDLYAPLTAADRRVPYAEAVALVLDTFESFHPEFASRARRVFDDGHIDSEVRKGKRTGAFCATALPRLTPWLLINYTGRPRDVSTMAHELGHAVHSMLAEEHSVLTQRPSLPLAETASVFAEMLVTDRLVARETDPATRRELLMASLDDIYATVLRQAYFVMFETAAHKAILAGVSPEELNALYLAGLREQLGDSVEVPSEFQHEWLSIPHIYETPFYCYAYSFGQLLVLALYRRYQREGEAFKPVYLELLARGGSAPPLEILAAAGVDPTDPGFWRGGLEVVWERIDELEAMAPAGAGR